MRYETPRVELLRAYVRAVCEASEARKREAVLTRRLEEPTYPATPVDCLISELRELLELGPYITKGTFERRVAQFNEEVAA